MKKIGRTEKMTNEEVFKDSLERTKVNEYYKMHEKEITGACS